MRWHSDAVRNQGCVMAWSLLQSSRKTMPQTVCVACKVAGLGTDLQSRIGTLRFTLQCLFPLIAADVEGAHKGALSTAAHVSESSLFTCELGTYTVSIARHYLRWAWFKKVIVKLMCPSACHSRMGASSTGLTAHGKTSTACS